MAQSNRQDITFGVELEFLTPAGFHSGVTTDLELVTLTRKAFTAKLALLEEGIPLAARCLAHVKGYKICTLCSEAPKADMYPGMVVFSKERPSEPRDINPTFRYFLVQKEILEAMGQQGKWAGLEISTPVFGMSELDAGLPQVSKLLSALRRIDMKVLVNKSCGMHIHVGVKGGMRLMHAKKVATLTAMLDDTVLRRLLPEIRSLLFSAQSIGEFSRFARRFSTGNIYDEMLAADSHPAMRDHLPSGWTSGNMACREWNYGNPLKFVDTIKLIWSSKTLAELQSGLWLASGARAGTGLVLREPGEGKPPIIDDSSSESSFSDESADGERPGPDYEGTQSTYEFRFPQMSFDKDFIKHWAELCCKIIELAMLPAPQFASLLDRIAQVLGEIEDAKGDGLEKIWPALSLQHQVPFWRAQLDRHERGECVSHVDERGFLLRPRC